LTLLAAGVAVIIAQLIPLPPELWRNLPGHGTVADAYRAAEIAPPWLPISLAPGATWDALLGVVSPAAVFIATLTLDTGGRRMLAAAILAVVLVSVGLGMLQLIGGAESPLRIYAITNPGSAVGFFANRNHLGSFLATSLPLAACLAARWAGRGRARVLFWLAAGLGFALVVAVGVATTGSRAGLLLVVIGAAGSVLVALRARAKTPSPLWRFSALVAPAIFALLAGGIVLLAIDPAAEHALEQRTGPELRFSLNPGVAQAGLVFAPLGSGVGSFATVYQMFEPVEAMGPAFVNHAHDDFIEVWLEAGVAGVALIAAFLAWWVAATWRVVQDGRTRAAALSLAGSLVVGMLLIHSLVDYPLRTPALLTLFAFACGLIVPEPRAPTDRSSSTNRRYG
jgi:O-antigen ligase